MHTDFGDARQFRLMLPAINVSCRIRGRVSGQGVPKAGDLRR